VKLFFKRAELLLHEVDGRLVLEMAGQVIQSFSSEKRAVAAYNRIRRELEEKLPPAEATDAERKAIMERYLADNLVGHNSWRAAGRKSGTSRTFGNIVKPH
jgi:hypothetical protein